MGAIAADEIIALYQIRLAALGADLDAHAAVVLLQLAGGPAIEDGCFRHLLDPAAQDLFAAVLGQALVVLRIEGAHQFAPCGCMPVFAHQVAIGGQLADRIALGHQARRAQFLLDAPAVEMFERALGQVLALGHRAQVAARLDDGAGDAAQAKVDGQRHPHGTTAHDHHLIALAHVSSHAGS